MNQLFQDDDGRKYSWHVVLERVNIEVRHFRLDTGNRSFQPKAMEQEAQLVANSMAPVG